MLEFIDGNKKCGQLELSGGVVYFTIFYQMKCQIFSSFLSVQGRFRIFFLRHDQPNEHGT